MGVFGTGIFDDDLACDVRDEFTDLIGDGIEPLTATTMLSRQYASEIDDSELQSSFWLALALTQWRLGRLQTEVQARAIQVIESGIDLARWEPDTADYKKRQAILAATLKTINSTQKSPQLVKKRVMESNDWHVGDLFAYDLLSGRKIVFRVIGHHKDRGGTSPILEILKWIGDSVPGKLRLRLTGIWKNNRPRHPISQLLMLGSTDIPNGRLERLNFQLKPPQKRTGGEAWFWRDLDRNLQKHFGID